MEKWKAICTKDYGETFFEQIVDAKSYTDAFIKVMDMYDTGKRDFAVVQVTKLDEN